MEWRVKIYYNPRAGDVADLVEAFKKAGFEVEAVKESDVSDVVVYGPFGEIRGRSMVHIVANQLSAMKERVSKG
ncbi:MAG: hypothetical protein F7C07_00695 [Desulfurococcales archaeon]|nr:hypothetical protein [Desulfurococcales archaeon]